MLIDFHTHTFPDKIAPAAIRELSARAHIPAHTNGTMQGLIEAMARDGVDVSVVLPVATNPAQVEKINRRALETNASFLQTGVISFGAMHPEYTEYKRELRWLKDNGFFGIGYPEPVHCSPMHAKQMVDTLHPTHVILAHMGGWKQWDQVIALLEDPDLYFDISFSLGVMTTEQFLTILKQHGSRRLLFGTDSPWDDAAHTLAELKKLPLTQGQFDDICYKNGSAILGLKGGAAL